MKLWGFEFGRDDEGEVEEQAKVTTPVTPVNDDGAVILESGAGNYGIFVDLDATYKDDVDLIQKYRSMSMQPEMENAIDDIVNDAIVEDDDNDIVDINLDKLQQSDPIKKLIRDEFENVLKLLDFNNHAAEIFRSWYVDGRLQYQIIIDNANPRDGIKNLVYIDSRKITKVRQIEKKKDTVTGADIVTGVKEFYIYNDKLVGLKNQRPMMHGTYAGGVALSKDSVVQITSGLYDPIKNTVLSYLHKAIRPMNQLRFMEDATVIYRVSRAPERRVFYIDVGGMTRTKGEQYLKSVMTNYRNKLTYDATTGEIRDDRKYLSMLEDFWMPRRSDGKNSTEITTLPGGNNTNANEEVIYFEKKLYKALGIPPSRLEGQNGFSLGKSGEISRDELKFDKFVRRLRNRFSILFDELLGKQLVLKGVCTVEEWETFKQDIFYDYKKDNNFTELKEIELLANRVSTLNLVQPFMGIFFSKEWVFKKVLRLDEDEIKDMEEQMAGELQDAEAADHPPLMGLPPTPPPEQEPEDPEATQQDTETQNLNNKVSNFLGGK